MGHPDPQRLLAKGDDDEDETVTLPHAARGGCYAQERQEEMAGTGR